MPLDMRADASEQDFVERSSEAASSQVGEGRFRFATYFVIGLAVIGVGAAIASFMPLP